MGEWALPVAFFAAFYGLPVALRHAAVVWLLPTVAAAITIGVIVLAFWRGSDG